jgi:hypothetical protein
VNRTVERPSVTAATTLSEIRSHHVKNQVIHSLTIKPDYDSQLLELLSPSCNPLDLRPRAVELLKKLYLPRENKDSDPQQISYAWILSIADLKEPSSALDTSLLSFCMIQIYVTGNGSAFLEKSLDLYSTALQELQANIEDPEAKFRRETLAAIAVLSTIEVGGISGACSALKF